MTSPPWHMPLANNNWKNYKQSHFKRYHGNKLRWSSTLSSHLKSAIWCHSETATQLRKCCSSAACWIPGACGCGVLISKGKELCWPLPGVPHCTTISWRGVSAELGHLKSSLRTQHTWPCFLSDSAQIIRGLLFFSSSPRLLSTFTLSRQLHLTHVPDLRVQSQPAWLSSRHCVAVGRRCLFCFLMSELGMVAVPVS